MSELKSKDILEAEALIAKHRAAWNDIQKSTSDYEEKYWNDNKDSLQAQGYLYTKNPESPWGGVWTRQITPQAPKVAQVPTELKKTTLTPTNNVQNAASQTPSNGTPTDTFNVSLFILKYGLPSTVINGARYYRYDPPGRGDFYIDDHGNIYNVGNFGYLSNKIDYNRVLNTPAYGDTYRNNLLTLGDMLNAYRVKFNKQGGTMNRIKYFQQGGPAPQQDIQQQVIQLVQAAMQGDQKATQTVNQIMEAAKAGDQQAAQLAQMILQVAQQIQGQATAAKWGAKLAYIKSLKFAKGGKNCPVCKNNIEMKSCGGKKAPKKDGGGWLELLPIYGTVQSGKRFFKNPSWKAAGEFGLDLLGDAALITGVGAGVGAATKAVKATKAAKAVSNTANAKKAYKIAKNIANLYPSRVVTTGSPTQLSVLDAQRLSKILPEHRQIVNFVEQGNRYVGNGVGTAVPVKIFDVLNGGELPQK